MGQLHNELHRGQYSAALTRALDEMRGSAGLERFGETLTPVIDLWSKPEWAHLRNERLGAVSRAVTAGGAGTTAGVALANPSTSQNIVVVEGVSAGSGGGDSVALYMAADSTADLGNSQQGFARDNRPNAGVRTTETIIRYSNTPVGVPANHDQLEVLVLNDTSYREFMCLPVILVPGRMLACYMLDTATAVTVNFKFRERRAPAEIG